jgi:hypothetical protein
MAEAWPWLVLAGLGALHGLNPGMGWLFAVALGLNRHDPRIVLAAPIPIALGHALSVAIAVTIFVWAGRSVDPQPVRIAAGLVVLAWALYHWRYGHRHRVRFGMTTGLLGLAVWSFLMASAHGAGLMLWPALMPLCLPAGTAAEGSSPLVNAALGVGLHTLAMVLVTTAVAFAVYRWAGVAILKSAWINIDFLWTLLLAAVGIWLLVG